MSIRTFIFCDVCNPMGERDVIDRRNPDRHTNEGGRRFTDNRAWFEGNLREAHDAGWRVTDDDKNLCPVCAARHDELKGR